MISEVMVVFEELVGLSWTNRCEHAPGMHKEEEVTPKVVKYRLKSAAPVCHPIFVFLAKLLWIWVPVGNPEDILGRHGEVLTVGVPVLSLELDRTRRLQHLSRDPETRSL